MASFLGPERASSTTTMDGKIDVYYGEYGPEGGARRFITT